MPEHDCSQQAVIGKIEAAITYFQSAEQRREGREERMALAMEQVAAQGQTIAAHSASLTRHEKSIDTLYERVREVEKAPAEDAGKVRVGFWNAIIAAAIAVFVGLVMKR